MNSIDVLTPANRALLSLRLIRPSFHIDKIHKNKIHSYNKISKDILCLLCSASSFVRSVLVMLFPVTEPLSRALGGLYSINGTFSRYPIIMF